MTERSRYIIYESLIMKNYYLKNCMKSNLKHSFCRIIKLIEGIDKNKMNNIGEVIVRVNQFDMENQFEGGRREEIKDILEMVLNALSRKKVVNNLVQDVEFFDYWEHRTDKVIEADLGELSIHRGQVLKAISQYLEKDHLNNKYVNWMFLNLLTYAEYISTQEELRKMVLGVDKYIQQLYPAKENHIVELSKFYRISALKLLTLIGAILISTLIYPLLGIAIFLFFIVMVYRKKQQFKKIDEILFKMHKTYAFINTVDLNWNFVEEIYKDNFKDNISWDAQIYKLIDHAKYL